MEHYSFDPTHSEKVVQAIVEGYREYIEHRKERHQKMKISSAFAWTKGNFIESKIADICGNIGYSYKMAKAGLTWDYLQFIQDDKKVLFLLKNAAYFNRDSFSHAVLPNSKDSQGKIRSYLYELSKINQKIDFPSIHQEKSHKANAQLAFSFYVPEREVRSELNELQVKYNEFHILTYKIDDAFQISEVMHYLPNPADNIAYEIEDLSKYITEAELTDEDREVIAPLSKTELVDPAAFDIGIIDEKKRK